MLLNCLPRRVDRMNCPSGTSATCGRDGLEVGLAVGRREHAAFAEARRRRPGSRRRSPAGARCRRSSGTTRAISARIASAVSQPNARREVGTDAARDVGEDLPLAARLADARARDLGAERDPALGGGRRAAALLLVARRGGQQHDRVAGLDEHLVRHEDVLVHAQRRARERGARDVGRGQHVEEVAAARPQHVEVADAARRRPSSAAVRPGAVGTAKPHCSASARGVRLGDRDAAGERGGVAAHLGAALHAGVAADRHEPAPGRPTLPRARPRFTIACTFSTPCSCWVMPIDQMSTARFADAYIRAKRSMSATRRARLPLEVVERLAFELGDHRVEPDACSRRRTRGRSPPDREQLLEHAVDERDVAAGVHREELVGDLRAEHRALGVRRHPVALEAGLAHRVDDGDLRAPLLREVQVLHEHGLRVRRRRRRTARSRSLSITSRYEHVVAATPIACFSAVVDGAWHTRAALSTLFVPIARAAFCAT